MKRLLFVDHAFHQISKSSEFFIELLRQCFEVECRYIEPQPICTPQQLAVPYGIDIVVVWQLDYLAPVFIEQGFPTIVVPMYDGSSGQPDIHWIASSSARFICFSIHLHTRLRQLQCHSRLTKYFPPPVYSSVSFDRPRAFLWRRRPEDQIDIPLVEKLFGRSICGLHVHDAPDSPGQRQSATSECFPISRTSWLEHRADYFLAMQNANIFIAPRLSEGIGHAFLEAMARGMLVVANNAPTHSEYICDGLSGRLFSISNPHPILLNDAHRLGRKGQDAVVYGHAQWLSERGALMQFIKDCPKPQPSQARGFLERILHLSNAYYRAPSQYSEMLREMVL